MYDVHEILFDIIHCVLSGTEICESAGLNVVTPGIE